MALRSNSIIYTSSTDFEGLDFQDNTKQELWNLTKKISDLQIKLEAEKKRNSHLEENYTKLPANLESLKESQAELEVTKTQLAHLTSKLKESQSMSAKFKKDLEDFREFTFREIKDKELYIISQSSNIRSLQNELNTFKDQAQKVCEEYESRLKQLKGYKTKYKHTKQELMESKTKSSMSKLDSDYLNIKLELESAQRKIHDLTRSREDLAKKCNDLEMKNQHLVSMKSDFKATLHRRDRTLAEMEYDFKSTLEGIESTKIEETSELLEKITSLERQIKDLKVSHELVLNIKEDEKAKEKYKAEDLKRLMEKLAKDKQRSDLELTACKSLLDESNNEIIEVRMEYEAKIEGIRKEHKEKVVVLKSQIDDLVLRNKELIDLAEVNRASIFVGDSLADELGSLNTDYRDSRIFKESIFRVPAENDKNLEKIKKVKEKKKKIKEELNSKLEILNELERNFKKNETLNRNLNSDIIGLNDIINDMKSSIKRLELEKFDNESEISSLKNINNELTALNKEIKDKALNVEYEMSKQKTNFEESVMALKKKYNDKILKYKEDILDLTQNSAQLRNNLTTSKTISAAQASELEASKDLLKKNSKLKEKMVGLENCLKSKTELINKLQSKLSELYRIPNVDANLNEDKGMPIIEEQLEIDSEGLLNENKDLKLKVKNLEDKIEGLQKVVNAEKEVLVVKIDGGGDKRVLSVGGLKGVGVEKLKGKGNEKSEDYVKVISEKIRQIVKEIGFSVEVVKSQGLIEESKPKEKKRLRSDSLDSDSEEKLEEEVKAKGMTLGMTETTQVLLLSHPSASSPQFQELEQSLFSIQQDLKIKTERFQKCESDYQDRITYLEETIKKLEDERTQYTYVTNTEMDEYTDSDEEKSQLDTKKIAVSIIDEFEPTEGSLLEPEDDHNPFNAFKESILLMKHSESDNTKISSLEVELAEKSNLVRQLQEQLKDLENQLENAERNNNELSENLKKLQEKLRDEKKNGKNIGANKPIHDCVLLEARMTLLEAHNHRLETELIVSKTNWGEMTNTLIRDINEMESKVKIAENDCRIMSEEKEELVRRINDKTTKKPSKWNIFSRKKRNSDIN